MRPHCRASSPRSSACAVPAGSSDGKLQRAQRVHRRRCVAARLGRAPRAPTDEHRVSTDGVGEPGRDARGNSKRSSRRRRVAGDAKDGTKEGLETTFETSARRVGRETLFLAFYSRAHTRSNLLRVRRKIKYFSSGEAGLETGYPEKICHHDGRRTTTTDKNTSP